MSRGTYRGRPARRRASGMTLAEVLLAIAILVAGLLAVFAMLNIGLRSQQRALNETHAALVAESVLAEVRSRFFHGEEPHSDSRDVFHESPDFPQCQYNLLIVNLEPSRRNAYGGALDREYFVQVTVRWKGTAETHNSITVNTVVFRKLR